MDGAQNLFGQSKKNKALTQKVHFITEQANQILKSRHDYLGSNFAKFEAQHYQVYLPCKYNHAYNMYL